MLILIIEKRIKKKKFIRKKQAPTKDIVVRGKGK
jgi:hypothetical protein